jgi:hypothetical protein
VAKEIREKSNVIEVRCAKCNWFLYEITLISIAPGDRTVLAIHAHCGRRRCGEHDTFHVDAFKENAIRAKSVDNKS